MDPVETSLPPDETAAPSEAPAAVQPPAGAADPAGKPPAGDASGKGPAEGGGTTTPDTRTPFEKRLDEVLEAEDPAALLQKPKGPEVPKHPEQLPAGWTRGLDGKLKNEKGQFATLPDPNAPASPETLSGAPADGAGVPAVPLKFTFPGRGPTDAPEELELNAELLEAAGLTPDRILKLQEANSRLNAGYKRREDLTLERASVEEGKRYLQEVEAQLRDPKQAADYVLANVAPTVQLELAERLLASLPEEAFEKLLEKGMKWDRTPAERRTAAIEEENRRLKAAEQRRNTTQADQAGMAEANAIVDAVVDLLPADWSPRRREVAFNTALQQLMGYADKNSLDSLDPSRVADILDGIGALEALGLSRGQAPAPSNGRAGAENPTPAQIKKAERVGTELRNKVEKKRDVAAVAGGGNGGISVPNRPPRGAHKTLEERLAWLSGQ